MADSVTVKESTLDRIGEAIRERNGETQLYLPSEMPAAIMRISGSGGGGVVEAIVVDASKHMRLGWIGTSDGTPIVPYEGILYVITTDSVQGAPQGSSGDMVVRWNGSTYEWVTGPATSDRLGMVRPGGNLSVDATGALSATDATTESAGVVRPDGDTILVDDGEISLGRVPASSVDGQLSKDNLWEGHDVVLAATNSLQEPLSEEWLSSRDYDWGTYGQPIVPEEGKVYLIVNNSPYANRAYRWDVDADAYVEIGRAYEFATQAEADAGTATDKIMSPDTTVGLIYLMAQNAEVRNGDGRPVSGTTVWQAFEDYEVPNATSYSQGVTKPDNTTLRVDADGTMSVKAVPTSLLSGVVSSDNLPSYVDDVVEGYYRDGTGAFYEDDEWQRPIAGETGKIYLDLLGTGTYRWSGSAYVLISNPIDYATQAEAEAGVDDSKVMTPLRVAQAVAVLSPTPTYDDALSASSTNAVQNAVVKAALDLKADSSDIPTRVSDLTNDAGFISAIPTMSTTTKGGAKVGAGLSMDGDALTASPVQDALADLATEVAAIDVPSPSTASPAMDGTAAVGTSESYARADHVHPTDTTRASAQDLADLAETVSNIKSTSTSDGTTAGPILSLSAKGWAEQDTTTGKNLLYLSEHTITKNGITFDLRRSSIHIYGTATSTIGENSYVGSDGLIELSAGTYTLSGCTGIAYMSVYKRANDTNTKIGDDNGSGYTFTLDESTYVFIYPIVAKNATVDVTIYPQIELGSTATTYEPYTGGAPSPSPDYPQEIRVAKGRNLWRQTGVADGVSIDSNGITMTACDNGSGFVASGTATAQVAYPSALSSTDAGLYSLLSAGTYTASSNTTYRVRKLVDGTVTEIKAATTDDWTFTLSEDTLIRIIPIIVSGTVLSAPTHMWAQIEAGSIAHPYVPYGHVGLDVMGKNLAKPNNISTATSSSVTWTFDGEKWHGTGTASADSYLGGNTLSAITDVLPAGTYTASFVGNAKVVRIGRTNNGTGDKYVTNSATDVNYVTFDVPEGNTEVYHISAGVTTGAVLNDTVIGIQLEKGNIATEWTPYTNYAIPIPLPSKGFAASLPDGTTDILKLNGAGKWEWENDTTEIVLTDALNYAWASTYPGPYYRITDNSEFPACKKPASTSEPNVSIMSDRFIYGGGYSKSPHGTKGEVRVGGSATATDFVFYVDGVTDVATWKSWLATHPVTVLYPLATPTSESGYVDEWPTIPAGASVTISELDSVGIKYFIDSSVTELARQWYARAYTELGDAIVDLAQRVSDLEG